MCHEVSLDSPSVEKTENFDDDTQKNAVFPSSVYHCAFVRSFFRAALKTMWFQPGD